MHPKLIFKIFVVIFLFELKTLTANANDPPSFSIYCMKMKEEMEKTDKKEAIKVPYTSIALKSDFSAAYIFAKINLLDKMAEQFSIVDKYRKFFKDNSVQSLENFVNYLRKEKGERIDRADNRIKDWVSDYLFGRSNIGPFLDVLEGIQMIEFQKSPEKENSIEEVKFEELRDMMIKFINKLKIELIYGQTYKEFTEIKGRLEENEGKINAKIKEADEVLNMKESALDLVMKGKKEKKTEKFEIERGYTPTEYKELYLKYKNLNDASLELYTDLIDQIPKKIEGRKTNNKINLKWETTLRAKIFKNAFDQIVSVSKTMPLLPSLLTYLVPKKQHQNRNDNGYFMGQPSNAPAGYFIGQPADRRPSPKIKKPSKPSSPNKFIPPDYVDPEEAENRDLDRPTILNFIEHHLFLPYDNWIKYEEKVFTGRKSEGTVMRALLRLDAGVILMAFERMQKCF